MPDWHGCGMSVMEMSHRGKQFTQIRDEAVADLRELLAVPDDYEVLFMQGGATAQNRSEEHTSELQSLMRISYAVFCLKRKTKETTENKPKLTQRTYKSGNTLKK